MSSLGAAILPRLGYLAWNIDQMYSLAWTFFRQQLDPSAPRLLATLTDHFAAVNVVRFARTPSPGAGAALEVPLAGGGLHQQQQRGSKLASGADDKLICIYERHEGPARAAFGSNEAPNVENWRQVQVLRGHTNNVVDLAWSPDGTRLASAR